MFVGKPERKTPAGILTSRQEYNIKIELKYCGGM
jgi:hypothetical protein